jgi:hypothetical protein
MSRRKTPGIGSPYRSAETRRIVIGFDTETFQQVHGLAVQAGTSFAEQARLLVEFGLETVENTESDNAASTR